IPPLFRREPTALSIFSPAIPPKSSSTLTGTTLPPAALRSAACLQATRLLGREHCRISLPVRIIRLPDRERWRPLVREVTTLVSDSKPARTLPGRATTSLSETRARPQTTASCGSEPRERSPPFLRRAVSGGAPRIKKRIQPWFISPGH